MGWSGRDKDWPQSETTNFKGFARGVAKSYLSDAQYGFSLREDEYLYRRLVLDAPEAILHLDATGRIEFANPALDQILQVPGEDLAGELLVDLVAEEHRVVLEAALAQVRRGARQTLEILLQRGAETPLWAFVAISPLREYTDKVRGMVAVLSDISERKRAETQMQRLAFSDALTGLPNRTLLLDRLELALAAARREGTRVGIAFIDIDRFKHFNDLCGHAAGDALLQRVAGLLLQNLRRTDTVARWAGDEFVVVFPNLHEPTDLAVSIEKLHQACVASSLLRERDFFCSLSIGVALYPEDGEQAETLLHRADLAMYRAKREGGGRYCFFRPDLDGS
ncbi:diguanylate cyclase domain-containing protein [Geoalkalibacter halelectricus]|uniref:Diguanylate cyclase n=1 Tax=Geoalkalibacter halelectricus TaxID=2847045 RepID=A0ABY5ZQV5_9BACT|nr:diguanylate cyclase [Geoalkalibacter halelectricus]MDO3376997.1 diguanylate cyclase [Geoalkalibacter halelectricus]UWZ81219.1 diguanylate cyclase [Geoalkalibacter halelectricus]